MMRVSYGQSLRLLVARRDLLWMLTVDDLRKQHLGSLLGLGWTLLRPFLHVGMYAFLLLVVFHTRAQGERYEQLLLIVTGMIPWLAFADALSSAATSITSNTSLVTRVLFPVEILPVSRVVAATLSGALSLVAVLLALAFLGRLGANALALPLLVCGQLLFAIGLAWLVATFQVTFRDITNLLPFALTLWMFLTPVVYSDAMLPARLATLIAYNPMTWLIRGYRQVLLSEQALAWQGALPAGAFYLAVFLLGLWVFHQRRAMIADYL